MPCSIKMKRAMIKKYGKLKGLKIFYALQRKKKLLRR